VREARRLVMDSLSNEERKRSQASVAKEKYSLRPFQRPSRVDEASAAWLFFVLCSTHEFDEHPVRHNEEFLNQELSDQLMWGPDTSGVVSNQDTQHSIEIFQDPHTKCFLLVQAFLERVRLPISDYVNDTKTITENVPRLLAAMHYIARDDDSAAGSFELSTQFSRTRQLYETRALADHDPLSQLPGVTNELARRLVTHKSSHSKNKEAASFADLRAMPRKDAAKLFEQLATNNYKKQRLGEALDALYALPFVRLVDCDVESELSKRTGNVVGKLKLKLEISRDKPAKSASSNPNGASFTLNFLLGSYQQRTLLSYASARIARFGRWTLTKELEFDWNAANADGGGDGGRMIVRLLLDEARGLDSEMVVDLH